MTLLGAMLTWRDATNAVQTRYVDIIPSYSTSVDVSLSMQLVEALVFFVAENIPDVDRLHVVSDNGPHFASHDMLLWMHSLNHQLHNANHLLRIVTYDFPEPTTGKSRLDTHFAYTKKMLLNYVGFVGDVMTPQQMFDGLTYEYVQGVSAMVKSTIVVVVDPVVSTGRLGSIGTSGKNAATKVLNIRRTLSAEYADDLKSMVLRDVSGLGPGHRLHFDSKASWLTTMLNRGGSGTRFSTADPSKFRQSADARPKQSVHRTRAAARTALESVLRDVYDQFESSHQEVVIQNIVDLRSGQASVEAELSTLRNIQLVRTVGASEKETESDGEDIFLPGAEHHFGLIKAGYALRRNERRNTVPKRVYMHLCKLFEEGTVGPKHRAAQVHEMLMSTVLQKNWRARIVVSITSIKAIFSQLAAQIKKEARKGAAESQDHDVSQDTIAVDAGHDENTFEEIVELECGVVDQYWKQEYVFDRADAILSAVPVMSAASTLFNDDLTEE